MSISIEDVRKSETMKKRGRSAVPRWTGWKNLSEFIDKCWDRSPELGGYSAVTFAIGSRASETLLLSQNQFIWTADGEWLIVEGVPVLKKGKKASAVERIRNIPIITDEPVIKYIEKYLEEFVKIGDPLFPSDRTDGLLTRQWAHENIVKADPYWWIHRIRSERATQLVVEHDFRVAELMKFFNWTDPKEALQYVRLDILDLQRKLKNTKMLNRYG